MVTEKKIIISTRKYPTAKSLANLRPPFKKGSPETRRIAAMGGRACKNNPNVKLAARLAHMRKNGLTKENEQFLHDMMTDSEMAAFQIMKYIADLLKTSSKESDVNAAVKTAMDWYKIKHGTRENDKKVAIGVILLNEKEKDDEILRLLGK